MDLRHPPIYISLRKPLEKILQEVAAVMFPNETLVLEPVEDGVLTGRAGSDVTFSLSPLLDSQNPNGEWGLLIRGGTSFVYIQLGDEFTRYRGYGSEIDTDVYPDGTTKILRYKKPPSHLACSLFNTFVIRRSEDTYSFVDPEAPNAFLRTCDPSEGCSFRDYDARIEALGFVRVERDSGGVIWI